MTARGLEPIASNEGATQSPHADSTAARSQQQASEAQAATHRSGFAAAKGSGHGEQGMAAVVAVDGQPHGVLRSPGKAATGAIGRGKLREAGAQAAVGSQQTGAAVGRLDTGWMETAEGGGEQMSAKSPRSSDESSVLSDVRPEGLGLGFNAASQRHVRGASANGTVVGQRCGLQQIEGVRLAQGRGMAAAADISTAAPSPSRRAAAEADAAAGDAPGVFLRAPFHARCPQQQSRMLQQQQPQYQPHQPQQEQQQRYHHHEIGWIQPPSGGIEEVGQLPSAQPHVCHSSLQAAAQGSTSNSVSVSVSSSGGGGSSVVDSGAGLHGSSIWRGIGDVGGGSSVHGDRGEGGDDGSSESSTGGGDRLGVVQRANNRMGARDRGAWVACSAGGGSSVPKAGGDRGQEDGMGGDAPSGGSKASESSFSSSIDRGRQPFDFVVGRGGLPCDVAAAASAAPVRAAHPSIRLGSHAPVPEAGSEAVSTSTSDPSDVTSGGRSSQVESQRPQSRWQSQLGSHSLAPAEEFAATTGCTEAAAASPAASSARCSPHRMAFAASAGARRGAFTLEGSMDRHYQRRLCRCALQALTANAEAARRQATVADAMARRVRLQQVLLQWCAAVGHGRSQLLICALRAALRMWQRHAREQRVTAARDAHASTWRIGVVLGRVLLCWQRAVKIGAMVRAQLAQARQQRAARMIRAWHDVAFRRRTYAAAVAAQCLRRQQHLLQAWRRIAHLQACAPPTTAAALRRHAMRQCFERWQAPSQARRLLSRVFGAAEQAWLHRERQHAAFEASADRHAHAFHTMHACMGAWRAEAAEGRARAKEAAAEAAADAMHNTHLLICALTGLRSEVEAAAQLRQERAVAAHALQQLCRHAAAKRGQKKKHSLAALRLRLRHAGLGSSEREYIQQRFSSRVLAAWRLLPKRAQSHHKHWVLRRALRGWQQQAAATQQLLASFSSGSQRRRQLTKALVLWRGLAALRQQRRRRAAAAGAMSRARRLRLALCAWRTVAAARAHAWASLALAQDHHREVLRQRVMRVWVMAVSRTLAAAAYRRRRLALAALLAWQRSTKMSPSAAAALGGAAPRMGTAVAGMAAAAGGVPGAAGNSKEVKGFCWLNGCADGEGGEVLGPCLAAGCGRCCCSDVTNWVHRPCSKPLALQPPVQQQQAGAAGGDQPGRHCEPGSSCRAAGELARMAAAPQLPRLQLAPQRQEQQHGARRCVDALLPAWLQQPASDMIVPSSSVMAAGPHLAGADIVCTPCPNDGVVRTGRAGCWP